MEGKIQSQERRREKEGKKLINELGEATKKIIHPCRVILSGRSTMGKTTLAVDIICNNILKDVGRCFAVCPTWYQQPSLKRLRDIPHAFPKKNVFSLANDPVFDFIFKQCDNDRIPTFLFVDDSAAESSTNKGNKGSFARLCLASPHLNLSIFGCFQRLTSCSPAFRDNCEGLISFIPSKMLDVNTIIQEFNPCPSNKNTKDIVRAALTTCWEKARFCFIWREAFTGKIYYYCGFNSLCRFQ